MSNFTEQDFSRLIIDKDFATEILLYNSHELLRSAYNLYSKEPDRMNAIINMIGYAVETHLDTKDKLNVIHTLSKEMRSGVVLGLRNMYFLGSLKITEFNKVLNCVLAHIENKEEGRIQERADILKEIQPKKKNITRKGFQSTLTDEQIKFLYNKVKGEYIDDKTFLKDFKAIFKTEQLPKSFIKVKWIFLNPKKRAHQTSLREFLKAAMQFETKEPDQNIIDNCFTDSNGDKLILGKNKVSAYTERWAKRFKTMISH